LLQLEKEKNEKLDQELVQIHETISSLKSSSGALQDSYDVLQKTHKDLEVQFDALWSSTSKPSNNNEASTSQVSVKTCDEAIAQENDQLKLEVKRLEQMVSELVKQVKVRPSQDNRRNMVTKFEKGSNVTKRTSQQSNMAQPLKKQQRAIEDDKIEYVRSTYLNARRPHIKSGIGYKMGDKHNSRVNNNGQEFIKFTKGNSHQVKQDIKATNHVSNIDASPYMPYHVFYASYVLMKNKY
jgi:CO/xanthine dehydrogenase Mo-binding subunit